MKTEAAGSVGRWIDAGRSSVVVALGVALALPTRNFVPLDGLPLDRPAEIAALAALLPFLFSGSLRQAAGRLLRRRGSWGPRVALAAVCVAIGLKIVLLLGGTDTGFAACYSSTWRPPPDRCEESYSNLFERHDGATRIDRQIDFGPSEEQAGALVRSYSTLTYERGAAATDWGLSFSNDLRFNQARRGGVSLHEVMPFAVTWRGTAKIPSDGRLQIRYRGRGAFEIGGTRVLLPPTDRPRTILARVPPGEQALRGSFEFPQRAEYAELRLLDGDGAAIESTGPSRLEAIAALLVVAILGAAFLCLLAIALASMAGDLWLLGLVAIAALAVAALSSPDQQLGFQYLAAALAPVMLLRLPRRPLLWAFAALLVVEGAAVLNAVSDLHAVLYRASGTDFLTYESFARRIVLDGALDGGEAVFFYQPGSRYASSLMHLLFGDGDVLITWWWMVVLNLPFLALLVSHRRRAQSSLAYLAAAALGFLILAVLNSETILSLVAMGASEVPTWALLPCAVAAPQLRPKRAAAWVGSSIAASLMYLVRTNQALGVATILASIAAALWRRRLLWPIVGLAALVLLLPTIHNLVFGDRFVLTTTSAALTQEVKVGELYNAFSDNTVGGLIRGHLSAILYNPPTDQLTSQNLAWLLWSLLALWLTAVGVGVARLWRRTASLSEWLLLGLPVAFLFPHLLYQVEVYFPRHIIVGYLAMGASATGVLSTVAWSIPTPRPVLAAAGAASAGAGRAARGLAGGGTALLGLPRSVARAFGRLLRSIGRGVLRLLPSRLPAFLTVDWGMTRAGLVTAAFLAPFSATRIAGSLTLGRVAVLVFAATLAFDLLRRRPRLFRPSLPAVLLVASYVGLAGWILLSSKTVGCNCDGKAGGFFEFAAIGLLALVAIGFEPRLRGPALLSALAGLGLAAALALAGVGSLNSATVDLTQTGGRLSGTYGNANELGFAMAVGMPIAAAFALAARGRARLLFAGVLLVLAVALVLTFSRGGVIAAAFGLLAAGLWSARGSRRRLVLILGGAAAAALLAAGLYSLFERERQDASFQAVSPTLQPLDQRDLSGWDSRARGPIPAGPSRLHNRPDGIAVLGPRGGGASFNWGEAAAGGSFELSFRARALGGEAVPISFALGDSVRGGGPEREALLGPDERSFRLDWSPRRQAPHAALYVWQRTMGAGFVLGDVKVRAEEPGEEGRIVTVPGRLSGSIFDRQSATAANEEELYVRSRLDAAELAFDAFVAGPLVGIGWSTFPDYSAERLDYGELAAHDQYLVFAAELGILGLLFFGLLIGGVVLGARSAGSGAPETAAIGALVATAAGLVFVEALSTPQLSVPVALAAAVLCARRRPETPTPRSRRGS